MPTTSRRRCPRCLTRSRRRAVGLSARPGSVQPRLLLEAHEEWEGLGDRRKTRWIARCCRPDSARRGRRQGPPGAVRNVHSHGQGPRACLLSFAAERRAHSTAAWTSKASVLSLAPSESSPERSPSPAAVQGGVRASPAPGLKRSPARIFPAQAHSKSLHCAPMSKPSPTLSIAGPEGRFLCAGCAGYPSITARDFAEGAFARGYLHATDRLIQVQLGWPLPPGGRCRSSVMCHWREPSIAQRICMAFTTGCRRRSSGCPRCAGDGRGLPVRASTRALRIAAGR